MSHMPPDRNTIAALVEAALEAIVSDPQTYQPHTEEKFKALWSHLIEKDDLREIAETGGLELRLLLLATLLGPRADDKVIVDGGLPNAMKDDLLALWTKHTESLPSDRKEELTWEIPVAYGLGWRRTARRLENGTWNGIWPLATDALYHLVRPGVRAMREALNSLFLKHRDRGELPLGDNDIWPDAQYVVSIFTSVWQDSDRNLHGTTHWQVDGQELLVERADTQVILKCLNAAHPVTADGGKIVFRALGEEMALVRKSGGGHLAAECAIPDNQIVTAFIGAADSLTVTFPPRTDRYPVVRRAEYFALEGVTSCEVSSCECGCGDCQREHSIHGWSPSLILANYVRNAVRGKTAFRRKGKKGAPTPGPRIMTKTIVNSIYWWVLAEQGSREAKGHPGASQLPRVVIGGCAVKVATNARYRHRMKDLIVFPQESHPQAYVPCKTCAGGDESRPGHIEIEGQWREIVIPVDEVFNFGYGPESRKKSFQEIIEKATGRLRKKPPYTRRYCAACPLGDSASGPCLLGKQPVSLADHEKKFVFVPDESDSRTYVRCMTCVKDNSYQPGHVKRNGKWHQIAVSVSRDEIVGFVADSALKEVRDEIREVTSGSSGSPRLCGVCPLDPNPDGPCELGQNAINLWNWNPFM